MFLGILVAAFALTLTGRYSDFEAMREVGTYSRAEVLMYGAGPAICVWVPLVTFLSFLSSSRLK